MLAVVRALGPSAKDMARILRNEELNLAGGLLMLNCDIRDSLGAITRPTMVSVGALDPITPVWATQEIIAGLVTATPNWTLPRRPVTSRGATGRRNTGNRSSASSGRWPDILEMR